MTDFLEEKNLIIVDKKDLKLNICRLRSRSSRMIKASLADRSRNHCGLSSVEELEENRTYLYVIIEIFKILFKGIK